MSSRNTRPVASADAAFKHFEAMVREWRETLDLGAWRVTVVRNDREDAFGACVADPKYSKVEVIANAALMFANRHTLLHIESTAVHELVHAILWNGYTDIVNPAIPTEVASHFEEIATEHITRSLLRAKYKNHPSLDGLWAEYRVQLAAEEQEVAG